MQLICIYGLRARPAGGKCILLAINFQSDPAMKSGIHPTLNRVCFVDQASGKRILTRSTMTSKETEVINGEKHYVVFLGISAYSHPFFTGEERFIDTAGRIDKFNRRYAGKKSGAPAGSAR